MADRHITPGALLRTIRRQQHISCAELGAAIGYSKTMISLIETNKRAFPDRAMVGRIIAVLGVSAQDAADLITASYGTRPAHRERLMQAIATHPSYATLGAVIGGAYLLPEEVEVLALLAERIQRRLAELPTPAA